ncbi:MAG TPA: ADYC domain-containing protein [Kofleriaceae bacterium]|nr:ADYC domain-containing protein [Kofleriaceae bacterium]
MKSSTPLSLFLILAASTLAGAGACALSEEEPAQDDPPELGIAETGKEMQGPYLLGVAMDLIPGDDADHYFSASRYRGTTEVVKVVGSAALDVASGTLNASNGDQLQFTRVGPKADVSHYTLSRTDAATGARSDPCNGVSAVPFLGTFSRTGVHEGTSDRVSFACVDDGDAEKCVSWGYKPGTDPNDRNTWRAHQACTREARADYCGTGNTHTREKTTIALADYVGVRGRPPAVLEGVRSWPPPPTSFYFEAAYVDAVPPVFCFGKARWADMPPTGPDDCINQIPDPRTDPSAHFCEEWDLNGDHEGLALPNGVDILTVNASAYNDLGLHVWKSGTDYVSTVQGYADGRPNVKPFPTGTWQHIGADGVLLRRPTGTIDWQDPGSVVVPAYIYSNGTDRVLGPDSTITGVWPPSAGGYSHPTGAPADGYLFLTADAVDENLAPLFLYERTLAGGAKEYLSTAVEPPAGVGYTKSSQVPLGYVYFEPR